MSRSGPTSASRTRTPHVTAPVDEEERELIEALEADHYVSGPSGLTPEWLDRLRAMARATMAGPNTKVWARLPAADLARLKARALREGVPYQTLIRSILHRAVRD